MRDFIDIVSKCAALPLLESGSVLVGMRATLTVLNQMVDSKVIQTYAITGAVAAYNYIEPTVTDDLDVLVTRQASSNSSLVTLGPILPFLQQRGYTTFKHEGIVIEGWTVRFLPVSGPLDEEALKNAETISVTLSGSTFPVRILRPEYLVANALKVGRAKDMTRIIQFLEEKAVDLPSLCGVIAKFGLTALWERFLMRMNLDNPCEAQTP